MQRKTKTTVDAVLECLDYINQHDADRLAECMSSDHVFIDSLGRSVKGRENMRSGWRAGWPDQAMEGLCRQ
jgi:ketosteroid isomerase-like protein